MYIFYCHSQEIQLIYKGNVFIYLFISKEKEVPDENENGVIFSVQLL